MILTFHAITSCAVEDAVEEILPIGNADEYISRYNTIATELGFSRIKLSEGDNGVCGFAAFDRLFIVALTTIEGKIYSIEVSTGSSYAETLTSDEKFNEAVIYAATVISPILSDEPLDNNEISTLAGKILYSEQKQIKIPKKSNGNDSSFVYCKMNRAANGGFEIIITVTADTPQ